MINNTLTLGLAPAADQALCVLGEGGPGVGEADRRHRPVIRVSLIIFTQALVDAGLTWCTSPRTRPPWSAASAGPGRGCTDPGSGTPHGSSTSQPAMCKHSVLQ